MRSFLLFYLLASLFHSPLLALLVVIAVAYLADARWQGRWFDPRQLFSRQRAISDLRRTVAFNEHDAAAHNDLGRLLLEQGNHRAALPHLERAIQRMSDSAETNYTYGVCLLRMGRDEAGEHHIRRALEIHSRHLYGEPQVVLARHFLQRDNLAEARRWAEQAVKLNTSSIEGWVLLGRAARELGDKDAARKAFTSARDGYRQLPGYLRLPNRRWYVEAKRGLRSVGA